MNEFLKEFNNPSFIEKILNKIHKFTFTSKLRIMHVCGTHENTIVRFGIRDLLPDFIELISGPGCPVCICPPSDIDKAIATLENKNVILTTFGDMLRVPSQISLEEAKSNGKDVRVVYSIFDAISIARDNLDKEVVFFAIGFETTSCTTAAALVSTPPPNFSVISSHRLIPPALEFLLSSPKHKIDAFILPGHVTTVTGFKPYIPLAKIYKKPMVVCGFEPTDFILGIIKILELIKNGTFDVDNEYSRVVKKEGNTKAITLIDRVFNKVNASWRGIGEIKNSGLEIAPDFSIYDAVKKFNISSNKETSDFKPGCRCADIILGLCYPTECKLFSKVCLPENPIGPCMVSQEGTCNVWFKYNRKRDGKQIN